MATHFASRLARPGRRRWLAAMALGMALGHTPLASAAAPAPPPELKAPAQPTPMPAFVLPSTAGNKLDSESLKGQVLVIRFWASW
jgi:hypothetical protein